jgi:hypothetical protein
VNGENTPVRVLTVRQPHAWALVAGHKDVENRPWRFPAPDGTVLAVLAGRNYDPPLDVAMPEPDVLEFGAIIGSVVVVGSHEADECDGCSPWAVKSHQWTTTHHWTVAHAVMLPTPIPARGNLHLAYATPEQSEAVLASRLARSSRSARMPQP